jgi:hypothetical protein
MPPTLWIGKLDQKTLVFDPSMQLPDCPHVFLWNTTSRAMEKYVPAMVRSAIRANPDAEVSALAATAFIGWKQSESQAWHEEESKYYYERRAKVAREQAAKASEHERETEVRRAREKLEILQRNRLAAAHPDARETLVNRHREAIEAGGGTYLGVRASSVPRNRRITHCYSCKEHLDNSIDIECAACGWILCLCSACGCGY